MQLYHPTNVGEYISSHLYSFHIHDKYDKMGLSYHQLSHLHPNPEISMDYSQCLDISLTHHPHSEGLLLHEISLDSAG